MLNAESGMPSPPSDRIRVGQIVGTHGLKGQLKVEPLTDFVERLEPGRRLFLDGDWVEVEGCFWHKGRPILKLAGIDDISLAEKLKWHYLESLASDRPELDEDEFLTEDLIGLRVVTTAGEDIGEVDEVLLYPTHDTLQVGEILIPVVKQFVKSIDLEQGVIVVELIPGMRPGEEGA